MADLQSQIQDARQSGYSDEQIAGYLAQNHSELAPKIGEALHSGHSAGAVVDYLLGAGSAVNGKADHPIPAVEDKSVSGFLHNAGASAGNFVGGLWHAATHPGETMEALGNTVEGAGNEYLPGYTALKKATGASDADLAKQNAAADAFRKSLTDRYGSSQKIAETLYHDPVGALSDLSMLADGAGLALRGAGVAADAANLSRVASAAHTAADVAGKIGEATNPIKLAAKPIKYAAGKAADALGVPSGPELAQRLYQSALKPPPGSNSLDDVRQMVATGLDNRIPVSEAGTRKLADLVSDLNDKIKNVIAADPAKTIDPSKVAQRVDDVMPKFANQVNPESDVAALNASKEEFLRQNSTPGTPAQPSGLVDANGNPLMSEAAPSQTKPIAAADAQAMKQNTYKQLGDKAYGELKGAQIEGQKALARGLKEELATQFPELSSLNDKESKLLGLQDALERAVRRIDNKDMLGIGTPIAVGAGAAAGGGPAAVAAAVLKTALDNPQIKSRLAILLDYAYKRNPSLGGSPGAAAIQGRVDQYVNGISAANRRLSGDGK